MKRTEFILFHSGVYDKALNKLPQLEKCLTNMVSKIMQGVRHRFFGGKYGWENIYVANSNMGFSMPRRVHRWNS